jgi:hypothetical protein
MFTWVCPQCGREVPPAYNECPDCAGKTPPGPVPPASLEQASAVPPPGAPPAYQPPQAPPQYAAQNQPPYPIPQYAQQPYPPQQYPPQQYPPQQYPPQQYAQPPYGQQPQYPPQYGQPRRPGFQMPTWLMAMLFALGFVVVGGGIYWIATGSSSQSSQKPAATVESPAAKPGAGTNPLQKYVEVTGVRFTKASKGINVVFVLINHADSDLVGLAGNVTIWGRTQKSEEDAVGTFTFQTSMPASSSKELTMPLTTKLKMMQMPDWQNVTVDVQITAPNVAAGS